MVAVIAAGLVHNQELGLGYEMVHFSYLPLAHVLEKLGLILTAYKQGKVGFISGNPRTTLKEDLAALKPTTFIAPPKIYSRFYDVMNGKIKKMTGAVKVLFEKAYATKLQNIKTKAKYTHSLYDLLIFRKFQAVLGGNVRQMMTGGAPSSPEVLDFFKAGGKGYQTRINAVLKSYVTAQQKNT